MHADTYLGSGNLPRGEPMGGSDATACRDCGKSVGSYDKYCAQCGHLLPEVAPTKTPTMDWRASLPTLPGASVNTTSEPFNLAALLPSRTEVPGNGDPTEIRGERRDVTVLFFDIKDFTAAARNMDSEDVYLIVAEAMRLLTEVVHRFEGTIDKFTGDGLMAIFGAPFMHEDDPVRAVYAAIEMQDVMNRLSVRWNHANKIQGRIGINTGPVVAGQIGTDRHLEYTVIGDTVNLASRLESVAQPATVLVSYATYLRTNHVFKYEVLPPIQVKGIEEPVLAARPLVASDHRQRERGFPGHVSPLVGRTDALQRLRRALLDTHDNAAARFATVTGGPGYGKSRVVEELRRLDDAQAFTWIEGRCLSYTQSQPYTPIADLLRSLCHIQESDRPEDQLARLRDCVERLCLEAEETLPYLAHILNPHTDFADFSTTDDHERGNEATRPLHRALMSVLAAEASLNPTVYIFEDLQWVDPGSLEFLRFLLQDYQSLNAFIIFIARDLERDTVLQPLFKAVHRLDDRYVDLRLEPLSPHETEQLVATLVPDGGHAAHDIRLGIVERSSGNPFYVEELVRMLVDRGGLIGDPGALEVTATADQILKGVPGGIKGVILTRFDQLSNPIRRLLDIAAAIGRSFPVALLAGLVELPIESVCAGVAELQKLRFLKPTNERGSASYAFEHTLTQEAIYDTLLKRDRQRLHGMVADAIAASDYWPAGDKVELLAHHLSQSESSQRALPYLLAAARNAAKHGTNKSAVDYYRRALQLLEEFGGANEVDRLAIEIAFAQALTFIGAYEEASAVLSRVTSTLDDVSHEPGLANRPHLQIAALRELSNIRAREGSYAHAITYLNKSMDALLELDAHERRPLQAELQDRRAWVLFRQGKLADAAELAECLLAELGSRSDDSPLLRASLYNTLGGVTWQQGNLQGAAEYVGQSLNLYQSAGQSWGVAVAYSNLGVLYDMLGNWKLAIEYYERANKLQHKLGDLEHQACTLDNLGILRAAMGQYDAAQRDLELSKDIRTRLGDSMGLAQSHASLAQLNLFQARLAEAEGHAQTALMLAESIGSDHTRVYAGWLLADAYHGLGRLKEAAILAERAMQLADQRGCAEQTPDCLRMLGKIRQSEGYLDSALQLYKQAAEIADSHHDPYRRGLALLHLGTLHKMLWQQEPGAPGSHGAEARSMLRSAKNLFAQLGAAHDFAIVKQQLAELEMLNARGARLERPM